MQTTMPDLLKEILRELRKGIEDMQIIYIKVNQMSLKLELKSG
jgi:hypothetical protein